MQDIQSGIRHVMSAIDNLRDDLKELSDVIWRSIDHNDPASLEQGFKLKQAFNDRWSELDSSAEALWQLLREQRTEEAEVVPARPKANSKAKSKVVKAAAPEEKASDAVGLVAADQEIDEDFKQKTPFGFILGGKTFTSPSNWALFYQIFLQELYKQDPEVFERLPDRKAWRDPSGKALFAHAQDALRRPLEIAEKLFAEADLPLSLMLQSMRGLARELQVPSDSLKILLKEDRRGTVETKPLAA